MSNKLNYSSIGKTVDGTTFCSGVETLAENIIEDSEEDSVIVFPSATGWASLRSSAYRMTTENAEAHLPLPIYKIKSVMIKIPEKTIGFNTSGLNDIKFFLSDFKNENDESFICFDATNYVIQKKEWEALSIADAGRNGYTPKYCYGIFKDNTFFWEENSNIIDIISTVYKKGELNPADKTPVWERLLRTVFHNMGSKYKYERDDISYSLSDMATTFWYIVGDVRKWQFRIEYVPMSSKTKIRARKNAPTKEEYIQPFNQRAEINAASAFGKNMYLTAQKTGCKEIKLVKNYTRLKDIPPLGALVRHHGKKYRLVANHYEITNTVYVKVTHTLSENWSEKSKHVAVDQKYRNWTIPQDTLWRNLYWEDYLRVGTSRKKGEDVTGGIALGNIMKVLSVTTSTDKTVDTFSWYTYDNALGNIEGESNVEFRGASMPCSTYGIANSMIFSTSFKDNLSAGLRASAWGKDNYLCEEALYCRSDGTLDKVNVILGEGCGVAASFEIDNNMTDEQKWMVAGFQLMQDVVYPAILRMPVGSTDYVFANTVQNPVFDQKFHVYKDPGEAIKFTYQIHLIGEDDCVFGNKFAEHNPLVKDWKGADRKFRIWALQHYVREGTDVLETVNEDQSFNPKDGLYTIKKLSQGDDELSSYGEVYTITLTELMEGILDLSGCKAWAITDENNNLYVACNDASVKTLYFQLHHKR